MKKKQADGWQPIATAPRDGTAVLLKQGCGDISVGSYHSYDSEFPWRVFNKGHGYKDAYVVGWLKDGPTHWKPLPQP